MKLLGGAPLSLLVLSLLPLPRPARAALRLPEVFADGLILQTWAEGDARSFVYGTATPGIAVNLTMTSADAELPYRKTYHTAASASTGVWSVQVDGTYVRDPELRHGPKFGPYEIDVSDAEGGKHHIADVTFGDVYLCLGDATMAAPLRELPAEELRNVTAEAAQNFSTIRLFDAGAGGRWQSAANASALSGFSALCYSSGRGMQKLCTWLRASEKHSLDAQG